MKTTTASADPKAFAKLQNLVADIEVAMMTTVTPDGALRSRPMATRKFTEGGVIWFFTSDDSGMVHDLEAEHAVNLSYADHKSHRYVSITGNASVVSDREKARELWSSEMKSYFPRGLEDPHLAVLAVRIETAEYWDTSAGRMATLFGKHARSEGDGHVKVDIRAARESG
jgi:general stress protein 26